MLKKQITFIDVTGTKQTEEYYFHMNSAEVTLLTAQLGGDITTAIEQLVQTRNLGAMIEFIQKLILDSVGIRTQDGGFQKGPDIRNRFEWSEAYAALFEELVTKKDAAAQFGEGVVAKGSIKPDSNVVAKMPEPEPRQDINSTLQAVPNPAKMSSDEQASYAQFLAWQASQK